MHSHYIPSKREEEGECMFGYTLDGGGRHVGDEDVTACTGWKFDVIGTCFSSVLVFQLEVFRLGAHRGKEE